MGMPRTHIKGFRPPDKKWRKMKVIHDACESAGIEAPESVMEFFGYENPDERGVEVDLDEKSGLANWGDDTPREGFEVEIAKLPKNITHIRFYNSY